MFKTTILPSDFYLKQRLRGSLWGFWSTGSVWSSPCLGCFCQLDPAGMIWEKEPHLKKIYISTRLSWKQVFRAFSWLMVDMKMISAPWAVLLLGRWWWHLKESLAEQANQQTALLHGLCFGSCLIMNCEPSDEVKPCPPEVPSGQGV